VAAMMWAAYNNQVAAIKKLIEYKADPAVPPYENMYMQYAAVPAAALPWSQLA